MTWAEYEQLVRDLIEGLTHAAEALGSPLIGHGRQNKIPGASGFRHQIDVSLKTNRVLLLFECKCWKEREPVGVEAVLVMASRLADIRAANPELEVEAAIVSTKPATSDANLVARFFGVQLDIVSSPREYALRIRERGFLLRADSLGVSLGEHATVVKRDIS
jgi:hypothetical protein